MSTEAFEDFYFDVCNARLRLAGQRPQTAGRSDGRPRSNVHITGPETDLRFSIAGIPVVPCAGEMNIPDGEVFTAPVRDSVEGPHSLQHTDDLSGISLRRRPARIRPGPDRQGRLHGGRR